jgi:hypothetical protein
VVVEATVRLVVSTKADTPSGGKSSPQVRENITTITKKKIERKKTETKEKIKDKEGEEKLVFFRASGGGRGEGETFNYLAKRKRRSCWVLKRCFSSSSSLVFFHPPVAPLWIQSLVD